MKINSLICLFILGFTTTMQAQVDTLSLDEAINRSLVSHPALERDNYAIQSNEALQNMKYNLGNSEINYQGDGLFAKDDNQVNAIGFVQNIPTFGTTKALNALNESSLQSSKINKELTVNELELKVTDMYLNLQLKNQLAVKHKDLLNILDFYYGLAEKRVRFGVANKLEALSIQSEIKQLTIDQQKLLVEAKNLEQQLQIITGSANLVTALKQPMNQEYTPYKVNEGNVYLAKGKQEILTKNAEIDLLKANLKPSFNVGYSAQNYYDSGYLSAFTAGIEFPLFKSQEKKKIEAKTIAINQQQAAIKTMEYSISQALTNASSNIIMHNQAIVEYETLISEIQSEYNRIAKLNYEAGEISYLEVLNNIQVMTKNELALIKEKMNLQHAIARYKNLSKQY